MTTTTPPTTILTPRDRDILASIARGHSRRTTGARIGATERTVQGRLRTLAAHFELPRADQAAIVRHAYRTGLLNDLPPEPRGPVFLTHRQREVLAQLGHGRTDPEIGALLAIGETTIGTHLRHIYAAIGARTRAHAVALDYQHRFRDLPTQWGRLRADYRQRITLQSATTIHAWNGEQTGCRTTEPHLGDRWPVSTAITCARCAIFLDLSPVHHAAA